VSDDADVARAYDSGRATFMGIEMRVARGALVPRAETELLARSAIGTLRALNLAEPRVIDMCCGVGNLACAIAVHVRSARVWAADLTDACVETARANVEHLDLGQSVSVHQGDLFQALDAAGLEGEVDVVVCNPPYISEKRLEGERAHLLDLEPREAFAAGPYGLSIHMRVVKDATRYLRPGGALLFEVGLGQDRQVEILFARSRAYEDIRTIRNDAGEGRVVTARYAGAPGAT
jgi:release factor glutamine methyltransferase